MAVLDSVLAVLPELFMQWHRTTAAPIALFLFAQQLAVHTGRVVDLADYLVTALAAACPPNTPSGAQVRSV